MKVRDLHAQRWTINDIAEETGNDIAEEGGWHRTTVSEYLNEGPPPTARPTELTLMTDQVGHDH